MEKTRDKLLNVEQVRKRLECSRRHVYNLIDRGDLPALKIGNRQGIRVKESAVEIFLDSCYIDCRE
ncbi:MAG: helix-turn-helix domain-containing protein [Desulfobacteraceae bacterium]|nr:helix-turn-helix domain-containing protein [Desulfobacteraceae bacterium]